MTRRKEYILPSGVRVTAKGYRQWRNDNGLCQDCDNPLSAHSRSRCDRHLAMYTGYNARSQGGATAPREVR